MGHGLEKAIGVDEAHGVTGADGREAQGLSQEGIADADRAHQKNLFMLGEEI